MPAAHTLDTQAARQALVDGQLRPNGILDAGLLHSFLTIPRDRFLPAGRERSAYVDGTITLPDGSFLPEPLVTARQMQEAGLAPDDTALVIGDGTGYVAALLADLVASVTVCTPGATAPETWRALGLANLRPLENKGAGQSFSLIFVTAAVAKIPSDWLDLLTPQGRLIAVLRRPGSSGKLVVVEKDAAGVFGERTLFNAELPYLAGHAPEKLFQF